jgi:hypothetical protein
LHKLEILTHRSDSLAPWVGQPVGHSAHGVFFALLHVLSASAVILLLALSLDEEGSLASLGTTGRLVDAMWP